MKNVSGFKTLSWNWGIKKLRRMTCLIAFLFGMSLGILSELTVPQAVFVGISVAVMTFLWLNWPEIAAKKTQIVGTIRRLAWSSWVMVPLALVFVYLDTYTLLLAMQAFFLALWIWMVLNIWLTLCEDAIIRPTVIGAASGTFVTFVMLAVSLLFADWLFSPGFLN